MRLLALAAGLVCSLAVARAFTVEGASDDRTLTVQVADAFGMPHTVLVEAQHHLAAIFGAIGISTRWQDIDALMPIAGRRTVVVILMSREMARRKALELPGPLILGAAAPPPVQRAWIFSDHVLDHAALHGCSAGALLGHVIAHESVHALARVQHSAAGVMRKSVRFGAEGIDDSFDAAEAEAIRSALTNDGRPGPSLVQRAQR